MRLPAPGGALVAAGRVALMIALLVSCTASMEPRAADAEGAVRDMVAAAEAGDCVVLRRLIEGLDSDAACAEYLSGWRGEGVTSVDIVRVARDGRDPNAYLVYTRVHAAGAVHEGVTRAVHGEDGRWTIVVR